MARHSKNRSAKYRKQADNTNKIATMVRHSKNRSASLVTNEEKKQTIDTTIPTWDTGARRVLQHLGHRIEKSHAIDTTIPTLDTGARRVFQNYLELPRNQHTIMSKEKPSGSVKVLVPR